MKDAGGGAIVNMASGRALAGAANGAHYSASKGGIIALTKSLALDWAPYNIRVNCVIPGVTDTAQPRGEMSDAELYAMGSRIPLGRIGQPEDTAAVVAFLLGKDSGYMTGQSVAVNGGAIMIP
jgi:NAD(P)-dependent dehydrogenase (short-subunit alcohol dehydrogenase family)